MCPTEREHSAQIFLGACYEEGKGVSKNLNEAIAWFTKAAEQEISTAQNDLAACYYKKKDYVEAVKGAQTT